MDLISPLTSALHAAASASSLTVLAGVGAAHGGHGGSPRHYELVRVALVVGGLGLGEDHVVHVEPGMRSVR